MGLPPEWVVVGGAANRVVGAVIEWVLVGGAATRVAGGVIDWVLVGGAANRVGASGITSGSGLSLLSKWVGLS